MKKLLTCIVAAFLLFAVTACSSNKNIGAGLPEISQSLGYTILEEKMVAYNGYYGLEINLPVGYVLLDYENISTSANKTKDPTSFYTDTYDDGSTVTYLLWFTNVQDYNNPNYVSVQIAAEEFDNVTTMDGYIEKLTEWVTEAPADVTDTYQKTLLDKETVTVEGNEYTRVRYLETEEEYQDYMHEYYLKQYGNQFLYISFYYSNDEVGIPGEGIRDEIFAEYIKINS